MIKREKERERRGKNLRKSEKGYIAGRAYINHKKERQRQKIKIKEILIKGKYVSILTNNNRMFK